MSWSCRRPGCGREAEVCITYDAVACQVWLDPISIGPVGGQPLCGDHAGRLSAPRGWVVMDRRTSQAALLTPARAPEPQVARPRRRLPRGWGQFEAPRLDFVAEEALPDAATAVVVAEPPVEERTVEPVVEPVAEPAEVAAEAAVEREVSPAPAEAPSGLVAAVPDALVPAEPDAFVAAEPEPALEPVVAATAASPAPEPAAPRGRRSAAGKPRGRLLSRAFESTGHQRSVITDSLGRDDGPDAPAD